MIGAPQLSGGLTAAALLALWEAGQGRSNAYRALLLTRAACPECAPDAVAAMSVGRRDAALLSLRERTFGRHVRGLAGCPRCGARVELSFSVDDIRVPEPPEAQGHVTVALEGYSLVARLPTAGDLADLEGDDLDALRGALLARCVLSVSERGSERSLAEIPPALLDALAGRMVGADPQAEVLLDLRCPACGHSWQAPFDIGAYLWRELEAWAERTLHEVHLLARAYGWSEAAILALSPWRRARYLELIG